MANIAVQLGNALRDRYLIERELGRGGMATVYLARDLKHDRLVALKVLHPELAATLGPDRFQREIRLAARLQHPHILTVYDSGEAAGQLWFTMPYVEGEPLRERLQRELQLPLGEAIQIARGVAEALDYAHRHGVVHRDIKPENILLEEGHALVADFGIARALSAAGGERLTETGLALGTPAYMSPEQAEARADLDTRSDIYSLGCVLYEMLAGEPPYTGPTAQAIIAKRFSEPVPHLSTVRAVPPAVEAAVTRALAKVPADRFPSAAEFARSLTATETVATPSPPASTLLTQSAPVPNPRWRAMPLALASLGIALVVGLGLLFAWRRGHRDTEPAGARLVAVLPFENLGSSDDEYFADGITDAVRGKLTGLAGLQVTASNSSNQYKRTTKRPQQIGRELGVDYLLMGKVRWEKRSDGTSWVQVSPELVHASSAAAKWQQPFDAALTDVFQVQADIAGRVAWALDVALGDSAQRQLAERPTQNLAAYDAYLRGEQASHGMTVGDPVTLRPAAAYYERATALDPDFALAWARLSLAHSIIYADGVPTRAGAEAARRAAERALAAAPTRAEGHHALGVYYGFVANDYAREAAEYEAGLRLAPGNADLLRASAANEQNLGRWDSALTHLQRLAKLDPRSIATERRLGSTLLYLRRYPAAQVALDRALALAPANLALLADRLMVDLAQGQLAAAQAVLRAAPPEVDPTALVANVATFGDLYWVLDDAQQQLLMRLSPVAFDNDRGTWGLVLAQTLWLRRDTTRARSYADSARLAFEQQLPTTPGAPVRHVLLGHALAYLRRKAEAIREGKRGVALLPVSRDAYIGPYLQHQLARIYILLGEPEKALDQLEPLLKIPYYLSPGWLKIDPTFDPLRGNPRFERLLIGK